MSAPLGSLGYKSARVHDEADELPMRCNAHPRKSDGTYVKLTFFLSSSGAMLLRLREGSCLYLYDGVPKAGSGKWSDVGCKSAREIFSFCKPKTGNSLKLRRRGRFEESLGERWVSKKRFELSSAEGTTDGEARAVGQ